MAAQARRRARAADPPRRGRRLGRDQPDQRPRQTTRPTRPLPEALRTWRPRALARIARLGTSLRPRTRCSLPRVQVGLHPALVSFDVTEANGVNVGFNPTSTVEPGKRHRSFYWYAGDLDRSPGATQPPSSPAPIEYGAINLVPADMMVQPQFGMVGALIVEPQGSTWIEDQGTRASATVTAQGRAGPFRDFVLVGQNRRRQPRTPILGGVQLPDRDLQPAARLRRGQPASDSQPARPRSSTLAPTDRGPTPLGPGSTSGTLPAASRERSGLRRRETACRRRDVSHAPPGRPGAGRDGQGPRAGRHDAQLLLQPARARHERVARGPGRRGRGGDRSRSTAMIVGG